MQIPTISTVDVRACDLPADATIRVDGRWCHLYDITVGGQKHPNDDPDITRISTEDLDERYVILRIAKDPQLDIRLVGRGDEAAPRAIDRNGKKTTVGPDLVSATGLSVGEYEDELRIVPAHDLFPVQVVTFRNVAIDYVDGAAGL